MSPRTPDFDDLVGDEVDPGQRRRLQRVHEFLVAAGPPPEMPSAPAPAIDAAPIVPLWRRRGAVLALAATLGMVAAFTVGLALAAGDETSPDFVVAMSGPGGAKASLQVFEADEGGNWPMELEVQGLGAPSAGGGLYQLWLTMDGKRAALCGSFVADPDGVTVVPMNAPWHLREFDGWVVVEAGSKTPLLTT